jgi:large subunit ribosomal protein L9
MKVILKDNIENLGKKGDIVKVSPGYGRNFLLPKKLALKVTATNMKMIEMVQKSLRKGLEKEMKVYMSLIEQLNAVTLTFHRKSGEKDTIFGSVSVTDIRDSLTDLNFDVEKKKILLDEPIKRLGTYTVPIKVFHDDRAEIKLKVVREGGPGEVVSPGPERMEAPIATESEPVAETEAAPVAVETVAEPEVVRPEPEPVAETPELEKPEEAPTEEPSPEEEAPAGDKDTDEKT